MVLAIWIPRVISDMIQTQYKSIFSADPMFFLVALKLVNPRGTSMHYMLEQSPNA